MKRTQNVVLRQFKTQHFQRRQKKVLVTGANGQIGTELVPYLREKFGKNSVVATDIHPPNSEIADGPFETLDVVDGKRLRELMLDYDIDWLIHNGAFLSRVAEERLEEAQRLNTEGLHHCLGIARDQKEKGKDVLVYVPSSIAAFGPTTPLDQTPDYTIQRPKSVYGVGKVYAELMGEYYYQRFGVDFRSLRYPGIVSYKALPGGGTTDAFVDVFYHALQGKDYECYLEKDEYLPMMYMPDCVNATIQLLEADSDRLGLQRVYNISAFSLKMGDLAEAIQKQVPGFNVTYKPDDVRQPFAASWPNSLDDSLARKNWDWQEEYDVDSMVTDMLENLGKKLKEQN